MKAICEDIKKHVSEVLVEWERLVREEPWYSLPAEHRIAGLPDVIVGLVEATLCNPQDEGAHRRHVAAASEHGEHRRRQGIPEHLILTEYHLLRRALWLYLINKHGSGQEIVDAIMRIDTTISVATNASMWGYHREEITALGKWDAAMDRLISQSPLLRLSRTE